MAHSATARLITQPAPIRSAPLSALGGPTIWMRRLRAIEDAVARHEAQLEEAWRRLALDVADPSEFTRLWRETARGWAFADQESEVGIRKVAAPLFNHNNHVDAALNVSGHAARVSMDELRRRYLPVLLDGARRISRALGATAPATHTAARPPKNKRPTYRPLTARPRT